MNLVVSDLVDVNRPQKSGSLPWWLGAIASRRSLSQVRRVSPVREPTPPVSSLYLRMRSELPLLAPVVLHASSMPALTAAWALTRETWLASSVALPLREAAIVGISDSNRCPYCKQTHRMFGAAAHFSDQTQVERYHAWGKATSSPGATELRHLPFGPEQTVEMAALAVGYHYVNRMVNVFLVEDQIALPRWLGRLRPAVEAAFTRFIARRLISQVLAPGLSLDLLPSVALPHDLKWASADLRLAATLAGTAHLLDEGARHLSNDARHTVEQHVHDWQGQPPGLSRAWVDQAMVSVQAADRPPAKLALLVALASYQVDDAIVNDARASLGSDREVIEVAAWAAMLAARRVGSWCGPSFATR